MFDANKFLCENFGTARSVLAFASAYGVGGGLSLACVEKWFQREGVPGRWLATLLALLEIERGGPVSLTPYINSRGDHK